ncbi:MAG: hypothetical protein AAGH40_04035 [Verrucomicrobiota bacterium]
MSEPASTMKEMNAAAHEALRERLGVADAVRFLNQYEKGQGNYTQERDADCDGMSVEEAASEIRKTKKS